MVGRRANVAKCLEARNAAVERRRRSRGDDIDIAALAGLSEEAH
jgi:hypothetical protein